MPVINSIEEVALTAGGGTKNLLTTSGVSLYIITGTATLTSSWTIQPSGTPVIGMTYLFLYKANIDLDTSDITIFGETLPTNLADKEFRAESIWNGTAWVTSFLPDISEDNIIPTSSVMSGDVTFKDIFTTHITANGNNSPTVNVGFGTVNTYQPELRVRDLKYHNCLEIKGYLMITGVDETAIVADTAIKIIESDILLPALNGPAKHIVHIESSTQPITPIMLTTGHQHPFNADDDLYIVLPTSFLGSDTNDTYMIYIDLKVPY